MTNRCLGVIAAMPEEIGPLLKRIPDHRKEMEQGVKIYRFEVGGVPVALAESGMGPRKAAAAAERLIAVASPAAILNFGFGGSVLPGIEVGELVLAERVLMLDGGQMTTSLLPDAGLTDLLAKSCESAGIAVKRGTFLTAASIMNKKEVAGVLEDSVPQPVLEMETAAIAAVAKRAGIPVAAIRGISDAADEELGFSLDEFCDSELNISPLRVLGCIVRKPRIIPQLKRLAENTKKTGERLAGVVEVAIQALAGEVAKR